MCIEIKEALKEDVLRFIESEPGYNPDEVEEITVTSQSGETWSILYGESIQMGIMGLGETPGKAFEDFIKQWRSYNGFEWIKKSRMLQDPDGTFV